MFADGSTSEDEAPPRVGEAVVMNHAAVTMQTAMPPATSVATFLGLTDRESAIELGPDSE
jgi:hypothetical protein